MISASVLGLVLSARALRTGCGWLMESAATWRGAPTWRRSGTNGAGQERAAAGAGGGDPGILAPTIFFLGLNGVFGALTHLQRLQHRQLSRASSSRSACCQGAGFTGAATGVNLARDIEGGWFDRLLVSPAPRWVLLAGTRPRRQRRALIPATFVLVVAPGCSAPLAGIVGLLIALVLVMGMAVVAATGALAGLRFRSAVCGAADAERGCWLADPHHHRLRAAGAPAAGGCRPSPSQPGHAGGRGRPPGLRRRR